MTPGTLYLQCRKSITEPWHTLNKLNYTDDLTYLKVYAELFDHQTKWVAQADFTNHLFRITDTYAPRTADLSYDQLYGTKDTNNANAA